MDRTTDDNLRFVRGIAVESYAGIEASLVVLMARLMAVENDVAAIVFFKVTSPKTRNSIIRALAQRSLPDRYFAYWDGTPGTPGHPRTPGLWALIEQLDEARNSIVHWHVSSNAMSSPNAPTIKWDDLRMPYYWARGIGKDPVDTDYIEGFIKRARFVQFSLEYFMRVAFKPDVLAPAELDMWIKVFAKPPVFPPARGHPVWHLM